LDYSKAGVGGTFVKKVAMEPTIREFLAANFFLGDDPGAIQGSSSLIEAGIIDSTGVLELVGFLEETYGIRIEDDELVPENLDSIDNIVRFVERKSGTVAQP
jgi:acyl carrier protein